VKRYMYMYSPCQAENSAAAISHRRQTSFATGQSMKSVYWSILLFPHNTVVRQTDGRTMYDITGSQHDTLCAMLAARRGKTTRVRRTRQGAPAICVLHCGFRDALRNVWTQDEHVNLLKLLMRSVVLAYSVVISRTLLLNWTGLDWM